MFKSILLTFLSSVLGLMLIAGAAFAVGMVEKSSALSSIGWVRAASAFGATTEGMLLLIGVPVLAFLYILSVTASARSRAMKIARMTRRRPRLPLKSAPAIVHQRAVPRRLEVVHATQQVVVLSRREKPKRIPVISQADRPADAYEPTRLPQARMGMDGIVLRKRKTVPAPRHGRPIDGILRWSPSWPAQTRPQIAA